MLEIPFNAYQELKQQIKEIYEETYPGTRFRLRVKDNAKKGDLLPGFKRYTCIIKEI